MFGPKTFMVFWFKGSQLGSLMKNETNMREAESQWHMEFLHKDEEGNDHYEIRKKGYVNVRESSSAKQLPIG